MGNQTIANYTVIEKFPKGLFGKTRLCESPDHFPLAIKIYEVLQPMQLPALLAQLKATLSFHSKHIINIRDIMQIDEVRVGVGMDYYPSGSLAVHLEVKAMKALLLQMRELALAVRVLHRQRKIPHGNIKPNNIFPTQNAMILSDIHCPYFHTLRLRPQPDGFDYRSKQHLEGKGSFQSDVFSLGMVFIEMTTSRRIRQLEGLGVLQRPGAVIQQYPSQQLLSSLSDEDLAHLIRNMTSPLPQQRPSIQEIIDYLTVLITGKPEQKLIEPLAKNQIQPYQALESIRQFVFTFDKSHPYFQKYQLNQNKIIRIDSSPKRYQAVAKESFPSGNWQVTFTVNSYGSNNEEIAIGVLSEERRKEQMSGNIDQDHSVAFWSNIRTGKGNLCENGVWNGQELLGLRVGGVLKMVVDTVGRDIQWWVDRQLIGVTSLAHSFWNQQYYLFVGLMGQGCELQIGQKNLSTS